MTTRNKLLAKLHVLLKQTGADDCKLDIYASYGVASASQLSDQQLIHLITALEADTVAPNITSEQTGDTKNIEATDQIKRLRSEILSLLTKSPHASSPRQRGLGLPNDWSILNPFVLRHGHKMLYQMDAVTLLTFKRQLLAMRESGWKYNGQQPTATIPSTPAPAPKKQAPRYDYVMMPRADQPLS